MPPDPIFDRASIVEWDSNWDLNAETNDEELFFPHHLMLPHFLPLFVMSLHPGATIPERTSHSYLSAHVQTQKNGMVSKVQFRLNPSQSADSIMIFLLPILLLTIPTFLKS